MPGSGLPDLIALAFESACDPECLQQVVDEAARYFRADGAATLFWPRQAQHQALMTAAGISLETVGEWLADSDDEHGLRTQLENAPPLNASERLVRDDPDSEWFGAALLAVVVEADPNNICAMLLARRAPGAFSQADQDSLEELANYMRRALAMNERFNRLFAEHRAARVLLDSAPRGILLLGQRGQATYMNDEARRICSSADGVSLDIDELEFSDEAAREAFQSFLDTARASDSAPGVAAGLTIQRQSEAPPYQLIAYGLGPNQRLAALDERESLAVAILHDPSVAELPDEGLLNTYFGLTPAESQLTQALCRGCSLPVAAAAASISVNTARTHLRSVFQKVGVHSQAALVQRVSQSLHFSSPLD